MSKPCRTHDVVSGDTLAGLAVKYNVSVGEIKEVNQMAINTTSLFCYRSVKIPLTPQNVNDQSPNLPLERPVESKKKGNAWDFLKGIDQDVQKVAATERRIAKGKGEATGPPPPEDDSDSADGGAGVFAERSRLRYDEDEPPQSAQGAGVAIRSVDSKVKRQHERAADKMFGL